jgi:hypothetical protein
MAPARRSAEVIDELLRAMNETVTSYHPEVERTSANIEGLIQGTACFPGGAGLWRGSANRGPLPRILSGASRHVRRSQLRQPTWLCPLACTRRGSARRLLDTPATDPRGRGIQPRSVLFHKRAMGLKPGGAEGPMPSVPGYREQCRRFLEGQVEIVKPRAVIALGKRSIEHVSRLDCSFLELRHPGDWCFRPLATRDSLLVDGGHKLRGFLGLPRTEPSPEQPAPAG